MSGGIYLSDDIGVVTHPTEGGIVVYHLFRNEQGLRVEVRRLGHPETFIADTELRAEIERDLQQRKLMP
ncbi:MAG: hypothetical protein QJR02_02035 [Sinobacteraceae bacterium]|nr:hypothetical protein [Nevskiaceae bacterium]